MTGDAVARCPLPGEKKASIPSNKKCCTSNNRIHTGRTWCERPVRISEIRVKTSGRQSVEKAMCEHVLEANKCLLSHGMLSSQLV